MKNTFLLTPLFVVLSNLVGAQTVSDIDGNIYNTVTIGTQTWMKENLKTTRFNNGITIPTTTTTTYNDTTSVFQWIYGDDPANLNVYGRLYSWFAVSRENNVCPVGWHVPSEPEWLTLSNFLGGPAVAGGKMKETGTVHWSVTDNSVSNASLFTALPGGRRGNPSGFSDKNTLSTFWTSTAWGSNTFPRAYTYNMNGDTSSLNESVAVGNCGFSVRCIGDLGTGIKNKKGAVKISMFPNPTQGKLTILAEENNSFQIFIYDMVGRAVFQKTITGATNVIDLDVLPSGTYVVKLVCEDGNFEQKFIKD